MDRNKTKAAEAEEVTSVADVRKRKSKVGCDVRYNPLYKCVGLTEGFTPNGAEYVKFVFRMALLEGFTPGLLKVLITECQFLKTAYD